MKRLTDRGSGRGASLVELALVLPLILLLIVNTVNFGAMYYDWITVAGAVRDGAQFMVMGSVSVGFPPEASPTQLTTILANDLKSLPNASTNVTIKFCTNNSSGGSAVFDQIDGLLTSSGTVVTCTCENTAGGAVTCPANEGGSSASGNNTNGPYCSPEPCTDPEPASAVLVTLDVSYNYQPLIGLINFPALHIFTTLPPTTIHRTAVMRMLN